MSTIWLILVMFAIVYALRITGLMADRLAVPETWERALGFAPVAVLSALAAMSLAGQGESDPTRLLAAAGAGAIAYKIRRLWACILGGLVLYWVLRLIPGL